MSILHITHENFDELVLQAPGKILLDFWATWCGPCQMIAPVLEEIAEENASVTVAKVNVDEEMELAAQFGVVSIPTLLVIKNGEVTNKSVGARPKAQILSML